LIDREAWLTDFAGWWLLIFRYFVVCIPPAILLESATINFKKSMKKNLFLITVTLALSLGWVGCSKSGKLDKVSTFKPPTGPVELKLKWPLGEHVVQSMEFKQTSEITVPGQANAIKQDMTMGQEYGLTVLKESPDGGHEVEMEFLNVQMTMAMGGKSMMNYDSAKKSPNDVKNPAAGIFGKLIGSKIQYFMDASNRVDRVEGVDALATKLTAGGPAAATAGIKGMFNEGYFKQMIGSSQTMPSKAVQPGDTWPIQLEIVMGPLGTMTIDSTYTFASWEQHGKRMCARLEFQGTIKSKPDANSKIGGMTMSISDGDTSGVSWFDPELGMTIDTTMSQNMKMNMTMPANPRANAAAAGKTQTITSVMKQDISIKLESVK
jgi:hypothetical protein